LTGFFFFAKLSCSCSNDEVVCEKKSISVKDGKKRRKRTNVDETPNLPVLVDPLEELSCFEVVANLSELKREGVGGVRRFLK
jgi:hypothetical protein